jgi:L-amino acid N-acyltransferase YncA
VETDPGIAEVAISLRDDYQNIGIGRQLMRRLACEARDAGYRTLMASIRNDNPAIWKVFNSLPFEVIRVPEGSYSEVTIRLNRPEVIKQYLVNSI